MTRNSPTKQRLRKSPVTTALGVALIACGVHAGTIEQSADQAQGKAIAFDESKGNCLACHVIEDGEMAGNIGPPLKNIQDRFPTRDMLRAHIYDPSVLVPDSAMPPYGRHEILTEDELNKVVSYIFTL